MKLKPITYNLKAKKGFTLIEILIVVAIIGVLASVVIVGLGPAQKKGRDARRASDLRSAQTGLELFYGKFGHYPGVGTVVGEDPACNTASGDSNWPNLATCLQSATTNIGITKVPDDPSAPAKHYSYYTSDGTSYVLKALLDDPDSQLLKSGLTGTQQTTTCSIGRGAVDYCLGL